MTVKLKGGNTIVVEAEHDVSEPGADKVVTSIQKLTLPVTFGAEDVVVMPDGAKNKAVIKVAKPTADDDPFAGDINLPIY